MSDNKPWAVARHRFGHAMAITKDDTYVLIFSVAAVRTEKNVDEVVSQLNRLAELEARCAELADALDAR